ncbi:hypothetical protein L1887_48629 [Cichorium endivia]|nr:hypothetical protein L1887_48629 [Cichorium endivia]
MTATNATPLLNLFTDADTDLGFTEWRSRPQRQGDTTTIALARRCPFDRTDSDLLESHPWLLGFAMSTGHGGREADRNFLVIELGWRAGCAGGRRRARAWGEMQAVRWRDAARRIENQRHWWPDEIAACQEPDWESAV